MKIHNVNILVVFITLVLFFTPFFWFAPGFVDIGGDGGRLYFIDPLVIIKNTWYIPGSYVYGLADIPYLFFLYLVKQLIENPTYLIALEHGLQLSLGFLGMYLITLEILSQGEKKGNVKVISYVGIAAGIVYVSLITKIGWPVALVTLNQVFLNVMVFYFVLKFCMSRRYVFMYAALLLSFVFSSNFGFGSAPQMFSFFPLAFLFLYIYLKFVVGKATPYYGLFSGLILFFGLHALHLIPVIASLTNTSSTINTQVFNSSVIQREGVDYFNSNHAVLGKMSVELFQSWLGNNALILILPIITITGFFYRKSRLLSLTGVFFAITLFLVTANITHTGQSFYQKLFYLPGFLMFRSFNEKWYFAFSFYYSLLFAISCYYFIEKKKTQLAAFICFVIFCFTVIRMAPFLAGETVHATIDNSNNVSTVYSVDPDLLDSLKYIQTLQGEGKVLTLPLTSTYLQVAYGKEGGAYLGISMVPRLTGRPDFAGMWMFAPFSESILSAMRLKDTETLLHYLSLLNIRYIFYNDDSRPINNLSTYFITNPPDYISLISALPGKQIFQKGFYSVFEIDYSAVKPLIFSPNAKVTYIKRSPVLFDVTIGQMEYNTPILLILSNRFYSAWTFSLEGYQNDVIQHHVVSNGYANGWTLDPRKTGQTTLHGRIYLSSQNFFYVGLILSGLTLCIIFNKIFALLIHIKK